MINDPEVQAIMPLLDSEDAEVRRIALLGLADYAAELPDYFVRACRDPDAGVRLEAARALEGRPDAEVVDVLIGLLVDENKFVRDAAAFSLSEILDPAAGPLLIQRFEKAPPAARAGILAGLRKLRLPQALSTALSSLDDPQAAVRREAIGVLGYLKDHQALPSIAQRAIADRDAAIRHAAVGALAYAGDDSVLPALLTALSDEDWQVRQEAAVTLGKLRLPASAEGLIKALADPIWEVRLKAANVLGKLREIRAVPGLAESLRHPVSNLRKEAAGALGEIGGQQALAALSVALNDSDVEVRKIAARYLG